MNPSRFDTIARLFAERRLSRRNAMRGAGAIATCFDLCRQLFHTVTILILDNPRQNEWVAARTAVAALLLADLGYFGFRWFGDLTDAGRYWLARAHAKTSCEIIHPFYDQDDLLTVWSGSARTGPIAANTWCAYCGFPLKAGCRRI